TTIDPCDAFRRRRLRIGLLEFSAHRCKPVEWPLRFRSTLLANDTTSLLQPRIVSCNIKFVEPRKRRSVGEHSGHEVIDVSAKSRGGATWLFRFASGCSDVSPHLLIKYASVT